MADQIATQDVHHLRSRGGVLRRGLGFKKLMDLNPGAFLSNGKVGLGDRPPSASRPRSS